MKNLICVLFLGMLFSQDVITTREYTVEFEVDEAVIIDTIIDLNELTGYDLDYYKVELSYLSIINNFQSFGGCNINLENISYYNIEYDPDNEDIDFVQSSMISLFVNQNVSIIGSCWYINEFEQDNFEITLLISGKFPQEDVGLNGDLNDDGEINVVDVVLMVNQILDGDTGDVGRLLNILQG